MASMDGGSKRWLTIAGFLVITLLLLYFLRAVLAPFFFGAILAYICNPLVNRLEHRKVPRTLSVILVMVLLTAIFILLMLVIVPLFEKQLATFIERLPSYVDTLRGRVAPWLSQTFGIELQLDGNQLREMVTNHWQAAGGVTNKFFLFIKTSGSALIGFIFALLLVPVVFFYLLRDWNRLMARINELIPRGWLGTVTRLAHEIDQVLGGFLRGQLSVMLCLAVFYVTALSIAGLDLALPIGVLTGLITFIPYLGAITGFVLSTLAALMQFQNFTDVIPIWLIFAAGQVLEGSVFTPWLVGDKVGLHPVAVIFAVLAGGELFGFVGVLLALPVSAALVVLLRYFYQRYLHSRLYQM